MARKIVWAAAGAAAVLAGWLYASPFLAMRSIAKAVEARDSAAVSEHVDFAALREDVKGKLLLKMSRSMENTPATNPIAGFAQVVAAGVVNQLVETVVSPAGVMFMLERGQVSFRTPGEKPHAESAPPSTDAKPSFSIKYLSWSQIRLSREGRSGGFIFRREGLASWKLVALDIPEPQP